MFGLRRRVNRLEGRVGTVLNQLWGPSNRCPYFFMSGSMASEVAGHGSVLRAMDGRIKDLERAACDHEYEVDACVKCGMPRPKSKGGKKR